MNNVILTGRITKDIELKKTQNNKLVTSFDLAVRRDKEKSDFIKCVAWEHTADFLSKYAWKGARIGIQGSITTRSYEDQQGNKRYVTEVLARNVEIMDKREAQEPQYQPQIQEQPQYEPVNQSFNDLARQTPLDIPEIPIDTDDLPFY